MKRRLGIFLFLSLLIEGVMGQVDTLVSPKDITSDSVTLGNHYQEAPRFPCSRPEAYVTNRMIYPDSLLKAGVEGDVVCRFVVDRKGRVINPQITKFSHSAFAEEVLRIVEGMPYWLPAMVDDNPVESTYVLSIPFRTQAYKERLEREKYWEENKDFIFDSSEIIPEFKGGHTALMNFIHSTMRYPDSVKKVGVSTRVICQFVIDRMGAVTRIKIVRSGNDPAFDAEVLRVIGLLPRWIPGADCRGPKFIAVTYTLPIQFGSTGKST